MSEETACPRCGGPRVRVSVVYMQALQALSAPQAEMPQLVRELLGREAGLRGLLRVRALRRLLRLVSPPSGGGRVGRTLSPDLVAGGFGLILVVALVRLVREQGAAAIAPAVAVAAAAVLYGLARKRVLRRYAAAKAAEGEATGSVERAVARWMGLICCPSERTVEEPDSGETLPLDELPERLAAPAPPRSGEPR